MTGRITLVGAGPGDAELLTLRGLRALQDADVIVADRLGARAVLDQLAAEGTQLTAEVIDVGKRPGHHPTPQDGINALLVKLALAGRNVVRLKGGDPFVFGRGREEQLFCEAAGVDVQVVPGVTSAISVPAVAGIPLTHRGIAASFTVASGHDQIDRIPGGGEHTVVLLMGVGTLGHSAHVLAAGARGADCPVAIIEDGFGERQRITIGTLGTIVELAAQRQVRSPAVVVVGDVVALGAHAASALSRSADEVTIRGRIDEKRPLIVTGSADRDATDAGGQRPARRSARTRWADAFDAGMAVDTGLTLAIENLNTTPQPERQPSR